MRNSIRLWPKINGNRIDVEYVVNGDWVEVFDDDENPTWIRYGGGFRGFFCEYGQDVSSVPLSIAVIPFLCNLMPMAWVYDADVYVEDLDFGFYDSLSNVKNSFQRMYKNLNLRGNLIQKNVSYNYISQPKSTPLVLFSGGVDAVFSMLGNRAVKPTILTVRGSDIFFDDAGGWKKVSKLNEEIAANFGLKYEYVESSFRFFQHYPRLDQKILPAIGDNWWHGLQHGIGLLGLAAPLAWVRKTQNVVISSSFSSKDPQVYCCASDPSIDTALRFFDCTCQHYDYTVSRQEKIQFICDEAAIRNKQIPLRVCWHNVEGDNCGLCEKCLRTIFGIYAAGANPAQFGFNIDGAWSEKVVALIRDDKITANVFWREILDGLNARGPHHEPHINALIEFLSK